MELSAFIKKGLSFQNSPSPSPSNKKLWGLHVFLVKRKIWWNRVVGFKKVGNVSLVLKKTSTFESYLSLSECWCLFCVFTPFLSEFFVFHMKTLILLSLINQYAAFEICLGTRQLPRLLLKDIHFFFNVRRQIIAETKFSEQHLCKK